MESSPDTGPSVGAVPMDVVAHEIAEGVHVLRVVAEIDLYTAPSLELEITKASSANRIIVDLTVCRYLDSAGYHVLFRAANAYGDRLRLVAVAGTVPDRVLRMMQMDRVAPMLSSIEEARGS